MNNTLTSSEMKCSGENGFLGFKPESGKNDEDEQRTEQRAQRKEGEVGPCEP